MIYNLFPGFIFLREIRNTIFFSMLIPCAPFVQAQSLCLCNKIFTKTYCRQGISVIFIKPYSLTVSLDG